MYPRTFIAEVIKLSVSCWGKKKTGKIMQKVVSVSQIVQPLFIVQRSQGPDCPVAGTRNFFRHTSFKRGCSRSTSETKLLSLSLFRTQFAPSETRITVETHLISNFSLVRPAFSRMVPKETAFSLFQSLWSGAVSSVALSKSTGVRASVFLNV